MCAGHHGHHHGHAGEAAAAGAGLGAATGAGHHHGASTSLQVTTGPPATDKLSANVWRPICALQAHMALPSVDLGLTLAAQVTGCPPAWLLILRSCSVQWLTLLVPCVHRH